MSGNFLLDTNIIIALFANDAAVIQALGEIEEVYVPSIVLGELYYGARNSGRPTQNIDRIRAFQQCAAVLSCDAGTAVAYGQVKTQLRKQGTPIPENDVWIASLAMQHELTVITRDAHFQHIDTVQHMAW